MMTDGTDVVRVGSLVTIEAYGAPEEWLILPPEEGTAPPSGRISPDAPLARAILGRRPGDRVRVQAPTPYTAVVLAVEP